MIKLLNSEYLIEDNNGNVPLSLIIDYNRGTYNLFEGAQEGIIPDMRNTNVTENRQVFRNALQALDFVDSELYNDSPGSRRVSNIWLEAYFHISATIGRPNHNTSLMLIYESEGINGIYDLASKLTDEFMSDFHNSEESFEDNLKKFFKEKTILNEIDRETKEQGPL